MALTEANLMAQCEVLSALVSTPADEREVVVSWLPLYHDMGLIGGLLYPLFRQRPLVLLSTEAFMARPGLWLRAISRHRGTVSPAPNFAYVLCLKRVPDSSLEGVRLDCWRDALNGAEPVSEQICAEFTRRFAPYGFRPEAVRPVYGLAEASLAVTAVPPRPELRVSRLNAGALAAWGTVEEGTHAIVSVGKPLPGIQVEVRSEAGEPLPEGRLGRIFVQGPSVMRGYLGDPEATASVLRDGWLDTGDLGFVRDGELHVCGRAKDVVIIRGANHAPQEFEGPALQVPGVRMGAAVAVGYRGPDAEGEELLVLVERARAAPADLEAQVTAAVLAKTGVRPARVVVLPRGALPRTSSGKLRRRETIRRYIAGLLQASSTGSPDEHPSGPDTGAAARSST